MALNPAVRDDSVAPGCSGHIIERVMQFHDWDVKKKAKRNPVLNTHRLVLVTGFIFLVLSVSARADTWYELESTNFVVYTTAKEKVARDLLNELEA